MKFDADFWKQVAAQIVGGLILFFVLKKVMK
jgi:hypothetical protein